LNRAVALYDSIAAIYDPWSRAVTEDIGFYVDAALASGGPVVELAVGTGRVAVPTAAAGIPVIGVDESPGMLAVARRYASEQGVAALVDLRTGDITEPPVSERVPLVTCPFRSLLHLPEEHKLRALTAARGLLAPGGRFVFDVFAPSAEDIQETDGRWLEREPGIYERADWNETARTLTLSVRGGASSGTFALHWLDEPDWRSLITRAGLAVEELHGWFDRRPYDGGEDMIWTCVAADAGVPVAGDDPTP
jgi:SAM-dependent methyltransferase